MSNDLALRVAQVVGDAGGQIVGRTKLQKLIYLLVASGLEDGVPFIYKHYGPYSELAADAARSASLLGLMNEREEQAAWGGMYSVYSVDHAPPFANTPRERLLSIGRSANAIELELAATALFLFKEEGFVDDPWKETERRKPDKAAHGRLEGAKQLYLQLASIPTPVLLPNIVN